MTANPALFQFRKYSGSLWQKNDLALPVGTEEPVF